MLGQAPLWDSKRLHARFPTDGANKLTKPIKHIQNLSIPFNKFLDCQLVKVKPFFEKRTRNIS